MGGKPTRQSYRKEEVKSRTESLGYSRGPAVLWAGLPFIGRSRRCSADISASDDMEVMYNMTFHKLGFNCVSPRVFTDMGPGDIPFAEIQCLAYSGEWLYVLDGTTPSRRIWCILISSPSAMRRRLDHMEPTRTWPPGLSRLCAEYAGPLVRQITVINVENNIDKIGVDDNTNALVAVKLSDPPHPSKIMSLGHSSIVHGTMPLWIPRRSTCTPRNVIGFLSDQPWDMRVEICRINRVAWHPSIPPFSCLDQLRSMVTNGRGSMYYILENGNLIHIFNEYIKYVSFQLSILHPRLIWRSEDHYQLFCFSMAKSYVFHFSDTDSAHLLSHSELHIGKWADAVAMDDQTVMLLDETQNHLYIASYDDLLCTAIYVK